MIFFCSFIVKSIEIRSEMWKCNKLLLLIRLVGKFVV